MMAGRGTKALLVGLLLVVTFAVFSPCLQNGWTNWDDPQYVLLNEHIRDLSVDGLVNLFKPENRSLDTYTPLTLASFAIEYYFVELDPFLYHLDNVLLHLLNVLLTFLLINKLTERIWISAFVAALFAIHPMHVESVAWITERKDLLFSFFYLLAALLYLFYRNRATRSNGFIGAETVFYVLALISFILSVLAKPQAVSLPVVLVLMDWYQTGKFSSKSVLRAMPFLLVSIFFALLATHFMLPNTQEWNLWDRAVLSGYAVFLYLKHAVFPFQQSAYYPFPIKIDGYFEPVVYVGCSLVIVLFLGVLYQFRNQRAVIFGWLFFFVSIGLSLHFIKINSGIVYDRFTYIAYSGLFFMIGIWLHEFLKIEVSRPIIGLLLGVVIVGFGYTSFVRCSVWKNQETLMTDVLEKFPGNTLASANLGFFYKSSNRLEEALQVYEKCADSNPADPSCINSKGLIHRTRNEFSLALECFNQSIRRDSTYFMAVANRGMLLSFMNRNREALRDMNTLVRLNSDTVISYMFRAVVLEKLGEYERALADHNMLISREPQNAGLYSARGLVHLKSGKPSLALQDYNRSITLNPEFAEAYYRRARLLAINNQTNQAIADANMAIRLGYQMPPEFVRELEDAQRVILGENSQPSP